MASKDVTYWVGVLYTRCDVTQIWFKYSDYTPKVGLAMDSPNSLLIGFIPSYHTPTVNGILNRRCVAGNKTNGLDAKTEKKKSFLVLFSNNCFLQESYIIFRIHRLLGHSPARQTPCLPSCKGIASHVRCEYTQSIIRISSFFIPSLFLNVPSS